MRFNTEIRGDLIIVTEPRTLFFAIYSKTGGSQLALKSKAPAIDDDQMLAEACEAANLRRERSDGLLEIQPKPATNANYTLGSSR